MINENLYQIYAKHFTAGCIVRNKKVTKAAPIIKWTIGKYIADIKLYCVKKGYKITCIG